MYGFDTGFVCYHRGWSELRRDDMGVLWEHFVLNEIHGGLQHRAVRYWRNKRGAEIDFVLPRRGERGPIAVECKWTAASFDPRALLAFRRLHPRGENLVVAHDVDRTYVRRNDDVSVRFVSLQDLVDRLSKAPLMGAG